MALKKRPTNKRTRFVSTSLRSPWVSRVLTRGDRPEARVHVRLGKPRRDRATGDFCCSYEIEGLGRLRRGEAWGVDSMQALQLAMEAVRVALAPHAAVLRWVGGPPGSTGFPRMIPELFGPEFSQRVERLVDRELERHARNLERRARAQARGGT